MTDIEIARNTKIKSITDIAKTANIEEEYLEVYGKDKAKVSLDIMNKLKNKSNGKLILVTSINPTPLRRRENYNFYRDS